MPPSDDFRCSVFVNDEDHAVFQLRRFSVDIILNTNEKLTSADAPFQQAHNTSLCWDVQTNDLLANPTIIEIHVLQ
jgi:hypothetical protein